MKLISKTRSTLMAATAVTVLCHLSEASEVYPDVLPPSEKPPHAFPQVAFSEDTDLSLAENEPVLAENEPIDATGSIDPEDPTLGEGGPHLDGLTVETSGPNQRYCVSADSPDFAIHSLVAFCPENEEGCSWLDGAYVNTPGDSVAYCGTLEQPGLYLIGVFPNHLFDANAPETFGRYSLKVSDTLDSAGTIEDPIGLQLNEAKLSALTTSDQTIGDDAGNTYYLKAFVIQGTGDTFTAAVSAENFTSELFVLDDERQLLSHEFGSATFVSPPEQILVVVTSLEADAVGPFEVVVTSSTAGETAGHTRELAQ